eukprot:gnl/TRDRNA2_/TRDRNA2_170921_c2_seq1.p1 gnl/TRDRNA2_/TRDRNA2_170921_c2~~gnl/TRDRNA2_/TRDRNA2_170921_c2_seq1.p1  ORF type:complete len:232 (-),score=42.40 gnl/TRDRNA2_/TRDRNA2_170921_c2_seq1:546-1241(-)
MVEGIGQDKGAMAGLDALDEQAPIDKEERIPWLIEKFRTYAWNMIKEKRKEKLRQKNASMWGVDDDDPQAADEFAGRITRSLMADVSLPIMGAPSPFAKVVAGAYAQMKADAAEERKQAQKQMALFEGRVEDKYSKVNKFKGLDTGTKGKRSPSRKATGGRPSDDGDVSPKPSDDDESPLPKSSRKSRLGSVTPTPSRVSRASKSSVETSEPASPASSKVSRASKSSGKTG